MEKVLGQIKQAINIKMLEFFMLLTLAVLLPVFIHNQWITGSLVNMILIIATLSIGVRSGLLLAILPSTVALSSGLLPVVLAPVVPFIIIGNVLLVLIIDRYRNNENKYWISLLLGAFAKFAFLYIATHLILSTLLKSDIFGKAAIMMSWPQFFTAIMGGALAWFIIKKTNQ